MLKLYNTLAFAGFLLTIASFFGCELHPNIRNLGFRSKPIQPKLVSSVANLLSVRKHVNCNNKPAYLLLCIGSLLITDCYDIHPNPGPQAPKRPCGSCHKAVTWKHKAMCCESCETWFHKNCQAESSQIYDFPNISQNTNVSWICCTCGLPNFSSTLFNVSATLQTSNQFSNLSDCSFTSSIGSPAATSSPLPKTTKSNRSRTKNSKACHRPLRCVTVNFQSLKNKKSELLVMIDTLKPDIIFGNETWLDNSISSEEFFPKDLNFSIYRKDRKKPAKNGKFYGGVLLAISNEFISSELTELNTDCEIIWASINLIGSKTLYISSFYRPPSDDENGLLEFEKSLKLINPKNPDIWISGDMNFPGNSWDPDGPSVIPGGPMPKLHYQFNDMLVDFNLSQIVDKPTRQGKCLDLFLTTNPSSVSRIDTTPPLGSSDHDIVFTEIDIKPKITKQPPRTIFRYKLADWEKIKWDISGLYDSLANMGPTATVDELWTKFKTTLSNAIDKNVPSKVIKSKHKFPWINNKIRKLMRQRDKHFFKRHQSDLHLQKYKKLKTLVQKETRSSYWNYISNIITEDCLSSPEKNKPKRLFSYLRSLRNSDSIAPLKENGFLVSDNPGKARILNTQFQSVFSKDLGSELPDKGPSPHPSMSDIIITTDGVEKLLKNLNPNKAQGPDNIAPIVLKSLASQLAPSLTHIFSVSLKTGSVPSDWTVANICPVFKKGEKFKASNYRPVSLTCICSKLLEHIISSQLMSFLESNNILYDLQHGFRTKRSCESQLLQFYQELASNFEKRHQTDIIIMDFAKAFDKVSHRHLLYKLKFYGINDQITNWISSFLCFRTQYVTVCGSKSNQVPVTSGVPQGTVLGPILFLIYINDLPDYLKYSTLRLFADDSILYARIQSQSDSHKLQADLEAALCWEKDWLMQFHPDKCSVLSVSRGRSPKKHNYSMHGQILEQVSQAPYLGVTLQNDMKFGTHIQSTINKCNRSLGMLRRHLWHAPQKTKQLAYFALVRSRLDYCAPIWDPHLKTLAASLEMVQRRAARYVLNIHDPYASVSDMLNHLQWQSLEQRRQAQRLTLFYKIINNHVAIDGSAYLTPSPHINRHSNSLSFLKPHSSCNIYKFSYFPRTIPEWNNLPEKTVMAGSVEEFKVALHSHTSP